MAYRSEDVAWLLTEWRTSASHGAEYMTWRQLVNRYPGKSDLDWLWGLVDAAVDGGYLTMTEGKPSPEPDSKVTWDRWELTDAGHALIDGLPDP